MNHDRDFAWEQAGFGPTRPEAPPPPFVHALCCGWTLCGLSPWEGWPPRAKWVPREAFLLPDAIRPPAIRCPTCLRMAQEQAPSA